MSDLIFDTTGVPPSLVALFGAVLGAIVGSFLGVIVTRWPQGEGVVSGRSHCDDCKRRLAPLELIPILSWLALRGRCRSCDRRIDPLLPFIEVGAAAIGAGTVLLAETPAQLMWAAAGWLLLVLAILDARHFWLPDRLTVVLAVLGLAYGSLSGAPILALTGAAVGWASLTLVGFLYERVRGRVGLGGGDPKLFGAIGAWIGPGALPIILLAASLVGLLSAGMSILRRTRVSSTTHLPFGTFLAVAAIGWSIVSLSNDAWRFPYAY
ncbi:MAG: prepilin peptidase [Pacificimonas sp.]